MQDGDNEVQAALLKLDQFFRFRSILYVLFQTTESYKMTIETILGSFCDFIEIIDCIEMNDF